MTIYYVASIIEKAVIIIYMNAVMDASQSRKARSSNFSKTEKENLVDIILVKYKEVIENKRTDLVTSKSREKAWKEIECDFNSRNTEHFRDWKSLKLCYENIKKKTKKSLANEKVSFEIY